VPLEGAALSSPKSPLPSALAEPDCATSCASKEPDASHNRSFPEAGPQASAVPSIAGAVGRGREGSTRSPGTRNPRSRWFLHSATLAISVPMGQSTAIRAGLTHRVDIRRRLRDNCYESRVGSAGNGELGGAIMGGRGSTRTMLATGGVIALLGLAGGAAYAALSSQPDDDGVFHGCYQRASGVVRLLTERHPSCGRNEVAIQWQQGGGPAEGLLTAGVDSFGNHAAGNADVTIAHPHTGKYVVTFEDVSKLSARGTIECATTATISRGMSGAFNSELFDAPPGEISTLPAFGANFPVVDQVVVNTYTSAGDPEDRAFWLVLAC
jgi:hypothetical protein